MLNVQVEMTEAEYKLFQASPALLSALVALTTGIQRCIPLIELFPHLQAAQDAITKATK